MAIYDLDNLNFTDKMNLLYADKHLKHNVSFEELLIEPLVTSISKLKFRLTDDSNGTVQFKDGDILYEINIHQGITRDRFSVGIRFLNFDLIMIRFDFGNTLRHTNNANTDEEEVILGSHLHFYSNSSKYSTKNVIPLSKIKKFKNLNELSETLSTLIEYTNINIS